MKKLSLLIPVAAAATMMMGCSEYLCLAPPGTTASSKLTICHGTGKPGKFQLLTIKASAASAHIQHGDFLAPAGAKKAKDCVEPTEEPEEPGDTVVVVPPVVVPPVVVPPVDTVVVPPVVVDTTPTPDGGDHDGGSIIDLPGDIEVPLPCVVNPNLIECLL